MVLIYLCFGVFFCILDTKYGTIKVPFVERISFILSSFRDFNAENKLRIPLSAYAAQIVESDCINFDKKKATLLNSIIINYYAYADCSISLRIKKYQNELMNNLESLDNQGKQKIIKELTDKKGKELSDFYSKRAQADVNWQITLNKKVKELLTADTYSSEEEYYGNKPGHYVRALVEEYSRLPFYRREEIIFSSIIELFNTAINNNYAIKATNNRGNVILLKPFGIESDPLSMYHYVVGYTINNRTKDNTIVEKPISMRLSRLRELEITTMLDGELSLREKNQIVSEMKLKGVQFLSGINSTIKVWLSDKGINKYNSQLHLRPDYSMIDPHDNHIYYFECTEAQIMYYFTGFGSEAIVLSPETLSKKMHSLHQQAADSYNRLQLG